MKIAISLLTHNDSGYLKPCLKSLMNSDINDHEYKLFAWDNNSTDETCKFIESLKNEKELIKSNTNKGIVIPRIKLYEKIKKENFDFLLELHTDMLFPKNWINKLFEVDNENAAILQPHILVTNKIMNVADLEMVIHDLFEEKTYTRCLQVHPWLVKMSMISKVGGYYDPIYSPQRCEDDDLVWRILSKGYEIVSTKKSWVLHYGGVTRHKALGSAGHDHRQKLCKKFGIEFSQIRDLTETHPFKRV